MKNLDLIILGFIVIPTLILSVLLGVTKKWKRIAKIRGFIVSKLKIKTEITSEKWNKLSSLCTSTALVAMIFLRNTDDTIFRVILVTIMAIASIGFIIVDSNYITLEERENMGEAI
ncbi:MAG: hypothetical protein ACRC6T_13550 [Sarcina sp.]